MKIRMYNCGFGDCFQIDEGTGTNASHLIVDYGWHNKSYCDSKSVLSKLKSANSTSGEPVSFLLTHYHEDHYQGFCEMIDNADKVDPLKFDDIYIPNVWDAKNDVELVALLLMSELKKGTKKHKPLFLIDFLQALLKTDGVCHFVEADDIVDNRYQVLWPIKDKISSAAVVDFDSL